MKHTLSVLLLLAFLLALLSGCAGPGRGESESLPTPEPARETPAPTPTAEPVPEALELVLSLPGSAEERAESGIFCSAPEEYGCAFLYPDYCSLWTEEDGTIRLSPSWFFARIILTPISRQSGDAPASLLELFEPGKWNSVPSEIRVGEGFEGLRMSCTKYDTYRRWIAWETEDFDYLLYGVCFDRYEDTLNDILDVITSGFRPGGGLLVSAPEDGAPLRSEAGLRICFAGAEVNAEGGGFGLTLTLSIENRSGREIELLVSSPAPADGEPFEARCSLGDSKRMTWPLTLPCEGGAEAPGLTLLARAAGEELPLAELPIRILTE